MKKIGIIGMGFVGTKMAEVLAPVCDIVTYDKKQEKYPHNELSACDFVMICVDTPSNSDGSVNTLNVEEAISAVPNKRILLRSTVPPGTTQRLISEYQKTICFSPEYVGESLFLSSSWDSFDKNRSFMIIGGIPEHRSVFLDDIELIFGSNLQIVQMSSSEAELVKYMDNSYFAMKICFVNEFRILAEKLGLNWHTVREGWLLDPRIERDHTSAFKELPGYGGKCLPKDVKGIIKFAEQQELHLDFISAIRDFNETLHLINQK